MKNELMMDAVEPVESYSLPPEAAEHYIADMLAELCGIAEQSQLKDLAALLRITVTAVETNRRLRR